MINDLFSPTAGSEGLELAGLELISVDSAGDKVVVAHVRSTASASPACPHCGARRHVTGIRIARLKDIPRGDFAVVLSWRRRHFACTGCHRPSHETLAVLEEHHRVTTRLVDWIWQEAGKSTFMDLGRRCGLSQRTVISLFQNARRRAAANQPAFPFNLGVALVQIAGLLRPVLLDAATGAVLDVYRSLESLREDLNIAPIQPPSSRRVILDIGLHELEPNITAAFTPDRFLVTPASAGRYAAELMLAAASRVIAAQAEREGKTAKTRVLLFSRRRGDLGRTAARRLRTWSNEAPQIGRAYELKEELLDLCTSWRQRSWLDWKGKAARLREVGAEAADRIDYGDVIAIIDRHAAAIDGYREPRLKGEFREYERTLAALAGLAPTGARSFTGTRAAVLQEFGPRPDIGEGGVGAEARGKEPS